MDLSAEPEAAAPPVPPSISAVLARLANSADPGTEERISVGEIADALRARGFGLIFLLLALPNAVPGPALPGLSTLTGLPLAFVAMELAWGKIEPDLPGWVRRRSMRREGFARLVARLVPVLERLEAVIRPRYPELTSRRAGRLLGAFSVAAALVLALPLPTANLVMGCGLAALGLGLMERDGGAIILGVAICLGGAAWSLLLLWLGSEAFAWIGRLVGW